MKPTHSILSNSFRYVPAMATSVSDTWSRFGWRPTSQERRQRVVEEASNTLAVPNSAHERNRARP